MNDRSSRLTLAHSMNEPPNCYAYACKFNDQTPYSTHVIIIEPYSPIAIYGISCVMLWFTSDSPMLQPQTIYVLVLNYAIYKMEA